MRLGPDQLKELAAHDDIAKALMDGERLSRSAAELLLASIKETSEMTSSVWFCVLCLHENDIHNNVCENCSEKKAFALHATPDNRDIVQRRALLQVIENCGPVRS